MRQTDRRLLSPVLSDEPIVGEGLTRRLRIVLVAVLVAFLLTNVTSYLIGQAVRAEADRDTRSRVAALEQQVNGELAERKAKRDAERADVEAQLAQFRRDLCVALDRVQPRDAAVSEARKRYGCTSNPKPVAVGPPPRPSSVPVRPGGGGARPDNPPQGPSGRPGPPGPPPAPAPPSPPPPAGDDGLLCLPVLGCIL